MSGLQRERFIEAVYYLLDMKIATSKTDIAKKIDISRTKLSEIMAERMRPRVEIYSSLCDVYNISPEWLLLGTGEMIKKEKKAYESSEDLESYPMVAQEDHRTYLKLDISSIISRLEALEKIVQKK